MEYSQVSIAKQNFWLDVILAVTLVIAIMSGLAMWVIDASGAIGPFLGRALHTWRHIHGLTVILFIIGVIVHLLWHWKWVKAAFRPGVRLQQVKINRLLDVLLFVTFSLVMLSGLSSHHESHAIAALLAWPGTVRVDPLHVLLGISMLVIVLAHQALHWKWIVTIARRNLGIRV